MTKTIKRIPAVLLAGLIAVVFAFAIGTITAQEAYADEHNHDGWTAWTSTTSLPDEPGSYYLTDEVTLDSSWNVDSAINLCLNEHSITCQKSGSDAITIDGGNLSLYNCGTDGTITHTSEKKGSGVRVNDGTFNMYSGTISGNSITRDGGGVFNKNGTFNMYGGTIRDNKAKNGGGVYVHGRTFNMSGGTISGNSATEGGGGITVVANRKIQLSGSPQITGNKVNNKDNNIYLENSAKAEITSSLTTPTDTFGPQIGISMFSKGVFTESLSGKLPDGETVKDLFFSDDPFYAATETTDGEAQLERATDMNGIGTADSPYEITSYADLKEFATIVNGTHPRLPKNTTACGKLMNDITCDDKEWVPIGDIKAVTNNIYYTGHFDGNHKVIRNLSNEDTGASKEFQGLFGCIGIGGEVKDVGIVGGKIVGTDCVGSVAGGSSATITNCYNTGEVSGSNNYAGGVVGDNSEGTITNCYNTGAVSGTWSAGGVAGTNEFGTITNCYNTGAVSGTWFAGGVVGDNSEGTITNCYNTGAVSGTWSAGGVAGQNAFMISNCYYDNTFCSVNKAIGDGTAGDTVKGLTTSQMTGATALDNDNMLFSYGDGEENPWIVKDNCEDAESGVYCCYYPHLKGFNLDSDNQQMDAADIAAADCPVKVVFEVVWKEPSSYTYEASPKKPEVTQITVSQKPIKAPEDAASITYSTKTETGWSDPDDVAPTDPGFYKMTIKKDGKVIDEIVFIILEPTADYTVKYYQQTGTDTETGDPIWSEIDAGDIIDVGNYNAKVTVTRTGGTVLPEKEFTISKADPITPSDVTADNAKVDTSIPVVDASKIRTTGSVKKKTMKIMFPTKSKVTNYRIQYRLAGKTKWTSKWSAGKDTYTIKNLKRYSLCQFRIAGYVKQKDGTWKRGKWSKISNRYINAVTLKSLKADKNKITVTWKKDKKASGYQILYSTKSSMSKAKKITVKGKAKTKYTIKKLKKNKKYYVQIRPIKKKAGKTYLGILTKTRSTKVK